MASVIRIKPYHYIHVLDNNANTTRVEVGPQTFTSQEHEKVIDGPNPMIMIPPRHYAIIANPVITDKSGAAAKDDHGNVKLRHGDEEIRFEQEPFPLYPGEVLRGKVQALQVVAPNTALRLRAIRDFLDTETATPAAPAPAKEGKQAPAAAGTARVAGDEWLWEGPGTYKPRIEVQVVEIIRATVIKPNEALKLRSRKACVDKDGNQRAAGEEWLVKKTGAYLPHVDEEIVSTVKAVVLTPQKALHLRATKTFTDVYGKRRPAGSEWLVTFDDAETHLPDVYEEVVGEVRITVLTNRNYAVVLDPLGADGKPQLGVKELRKGPVSFFLLQLQAQSAAVESTGQATAEAKARAEAAQIEGEAAVTMSKLKAQSTKIKSEAELEELKLKQEAEISYTKALDELELQKAKELATIESKKFKDTVASIGADTIASIAQAGPEMQAKLLQGLGIQSLLITDGNSPINLFSTASGLISKQ